MATKKNTKETRGTGFAGPTIGIPLPKGATIKKNGDGTVTVVHPKKTNKKK